ncbi:MAG: uncharacterized protein H6Q10_3233 [Acidobacteria bacterium]|nr:uncharacterized protein [Acidobacteriota bacterium]
MSEDARQAFFKTPAGRARLAYEKGYRVFQFDYDATGPLTVEMLNSVCDEGWELVSGSFVFHSMREKGDDVRLGSGKNVFAIGPTTGFYLFRRNEALRRAPANPWEAV